MKCLFWCNIRRSDCVLTAKINLRSAYLISTIQFDTPLCTEILYRVKDGVITFIYVTTELSIADDIDASYVTVSPAKLWTTFRESLVSDRDGNFAANCSLMVLIKTIMTMSFPRQSTTRWFSHHCSPMTRSKRSVLAAVC